eukprot:SAG22_NODE_1112_length_5535_cov_11.367918_2_plen_148_part_00
MIGTDNCPAGSISEDPSFLLMSAGSVWGGANRANGPAVGEASNTIEAHKLVCGRVDATVPLGAFRGGKDLCEEEWAPSLAVADWHCWHPLSASLSASDTQSRLHGPSRRTAVPAAGARVHVHCMHMHGAEIRGRSQHDNAACVECVK